MGYSYIAGCYQLNIIVIDIDIYIGIYLYRLYNYTKYDNRDTTVR